MNKWDRHGIEEAKLIANLSKDPSTKVGCYISDKKNRSVSKGYNGAPRNLPDDGWVKGDRERKLAATIHAEMNAILFAERDRLEGATLYCTHPPCSNCAAVIAQTGIARVVCPEPTEDFVARWGLLGKELLENAGVYLEYA